MCWVSAWDFKMSTFATHQTERLLQRTLLPPRTSSHALESPTLSKQTQKLHSLLANFKPPTSPSLIQETIDTLKCNNSTVVTHELSKEENALRRTAIGAVTASIYGRVLDMMLQQATEADAEANW